ncbi:oxygen-dependent tRNA uridine(34) hydroxylase TrhO [Alicyclobacillus fastidiosus]|uniref:tRNA uridine(34) hydroxylase n=1 Tax=Alicyclobacillus fastidiosus TaxID=392011 RepID=A0ABV5AGU7_9BACL|nr:rhodanese-related sulfurtransferase [Alicyclobacillus fastidiosus]WEH11641.1 rhodanese-related sulfurtransferase [Alicyclobacillus fastidiosus]
MKNYQILLYYMYTPIEDPEQFARDHAALCESLGLLGRIIVASEGINGTVSGLVESTEAYMQIMHADARFKDMVFKVDASDKHAFKKLSVRHKREIVNFHLDEDIDPRVETGKKLKPKEFHDMLQRDDVVVIDGRNDYEYEIGHFRKAIKPDVKAFREFPQWFEEHRDELAGKTVLTYCTGGIRCEKLSGFLVREGLNDVYQLDGGIVTYSKDPEVRGHLFDGKCYVFDERIAVQINQTDEDVVVSRCEHCDKACDRYINCGYLDCHRQHICCEDCERTMRGFCSAECEVQAKSNDRVDPLVLHLQTTVG